MNMEENNEYNSFIKQMNSAVYQPFDVGFQKNIHNSLNFKADQNTLIDSAMKPVLNESYTVSNDLNGENLLSIIYEEDTNIINSSISCSPVSVVNKYNNALSKKQIALQQQNSSTNSVDKVSESCFQDFKEKKESHSDSDESLGILPSTILDDAEWDDLMNHEKNRVNLNTASPANNMDMEIFSTENIMADTSFPEVFLPVCNVSNGAVLNNEEVDIFIQNDLDMLKCASTPKHETNFSDLSYEVEDALNLTFNLSSEFHKEHSLLKQNKVHFTQQSNENMKSFNITRNSETKAEIGLNLTFEQDPYQNSSAIKLDVRYENSDFQDKSNQRTEILNTTYEKELKNSLNATKRSEKFLFTVDDTKGKSNFAKLESFTKDKTKNKSYKSKCRNSVGCVGSFEPLTCHVIGKQNRRNSMSGNCVTSSKENILDVNVANSSHKNLPNHYFNRNHIANLVPNGKSLINTCTTVRKCSKSMSKNSTLKSKPSVKSKTKGPNVLQNSQENNLNETINLSPPRNHLGKTTVKKSWSLNVVYPKISSIGKCDLISGGNENKMASKSINPLKFGKNMKPTEMECKLKNRTNKDISVKSVVCDDRKKKIPRSNDKLLLPETSALSCKIKRDLKRNCSFKACPSKGTVDVSASRKSLNEPSVIFVSQQSIGKQCNTTGNTNIKKSYASRALECNLPKPMKVDLNATILLSNQKTIEEPKFRNQRRSCIPLLKASSVQRCKFGSQCKSSASTDPLPKNFTKRNDKEISTHNMTLRKHTPAVPRKV